MVVRDRAPAGAFCWADLWTSDVGRARSFYGELFGWEAQEPDSRFGGYFQFTRQGVPVAGCMGDMGDMKAVNAWKPYIATDDIAKTVEVAAARGAHLAGPPMPVDGLGVQAVMTDPGGATVGTWQAGTFPGFTVLDEHGAPSWFELHTGHHREAVAFYSEVFSCQVTVHSDSDQFRYFTIRPESGGDEVGGLMDARSFRPEGSPDGWDIYWEVDDCAAGVDEAVSLGASLILGPDDSPYGVIALLRDPMGASFKLRTGHAA